MQFYYAWPPLKKIPSGFSEFLRSYAEFHFSKNRLKSISCGISVTFGPLCLYYTSMESAFGALSKILWMTSLGVISIYY